MIIQFLPIAIIMNKFIITLLHICVEVKIYNDTGRPASFTGRYMYKIHR